MAPRGAPRVPRFNRFCKVPPETALCCYPAPVTGDLCCAQPASPLRAKPHPARSSGGRLRGFVVAAAAAAGITIAAPTWATAQSVASAEAPAQAAAPTNPAEAAYQRGTVVVLDRCKALRASYERGDRRPQALHALADCYLLEEADVWRADALRDDADRLRAAGEPPSAPPDAMDLTQLDEQWTSACGEFEQSLALEPSVGAQLAVALCRVRQGKLETSRQLLEGMTPQLTALAASKVAFDVNRLALVQALLADIERVQPQVTLHATRAAASMAEPGGSSATAATAATAAQDVDDLEPAIELSIDGRPVPARVAQPLDAGRYVITARSGSATAETTLALAPRSRSTLSVEVTPATSARAWRLAAGSLAGVSLALAVGGGVAWWQAEDTLAELEAAGGRERQDGFECPNSECRALADDINLARTLRGVAFVGAGAAAAGAVVVYLMTPPESPTKLRWLPAVERGALSLSVQGGF